MAVSAHWPGDSGVTSSRWAQDSDIYRGKSQITMRTARNIVREFTQRQALRELTSRDVYFEQLRQESFRRARRSEAIKGALTLVGLLVLVIVAVLA